MGSKRFDFTEFFDQTVEIQSRDYASQSNGGLAMTPVAKATALCSVHRLTGSKASVGDDSLGGTPAVDASHAFVTSEALDLTNGDIALDAYGVAYDIVYWESVVSHAGSYFAFYGREIRQ